MSLSLHDKARIYHELAKLVKSGFGFNRAADLLFQQASTSGQRAFAQAILEGLDSGKTISQSLSARSLGVTNLEISIIEAAESGGVLEEGFSYLRTYFESLLKTRRDIRARFVYPLVLLHVAAILPALPKLVAGQSAWTAFQVTMISLAVAYVFLAAVFLGGAWLSRAAQSQPAVDRLLGLIPLIGKLRLFLALERFCNVFRMYLLCGQKISTGAAAAGEASQAGRILAASQRLAATAAAGSPIGPEMQRHGVFPAEFSRSFTTAELTGSLTEDLRQWAGFYGESVRGQLEKVSFWVPRLFYVLVAIYVAWRILSMAREIYQPLFDQLQNGL